MRDRLIATVLLGVLAMGGVPARASELEPVVTEQSRAPDPERPCEIPLAEGAELSPMEQCQMKLLQKRCAEGDACLADCFANSRHRPSRFSDEFIEDLPIPVAGGCWHVCFAYSGTEWTKPDGWSKCDDLDPRLPSQVRE